MDVEATDSKDTDGARSVRASSISEAALDAYDSEEGRWAMQGAYHPLHADICVPHSFFLLRLPVSCFTGADNEEFEKSLEGQPPEKQRQKRRRRRQSAQRGV